VIPLDFEDLTADEVSRHFGRRRALSRISFQTRKGSILGLLGPNGAGKSTMLAVLATLLRASSGAVRYGTYTAGASGAALRSRIGILGHDLFLYPELTARENLAFFAGLYGAGDPQKAADVALQRSGLVDRADDPVASFSRGMRQRVALERALIHGPRLVLLDEPFTGLDAGAADQLRSSLEIRLARGHAIVLVTHDLTDAWNLAARVAVLIGGRWAAEETRQGSLESFLPRYQGLIGA